MARMSFRSPVLPLALLAASLARPAVAFADQQDPKGDARLTLVAEDGATLEVGDDSPEGWTEVCRAPCEVAVSSRRTYRVRLGDRVTELRVSPGAHTRVHLSPRSPARTVAGTALVSVGVLLVGLGGYVALRFNRSSDAEDFQAGPFVAGLAVLGGGAVLGGALLLRQPQRWVSESSVMTVRLAPTLWLTPQGLLFLPRPIGSRLAPLGSPRPARAAASGSARRTIATRTAVSCDPIRGEQRGRRRVVVRDRDLHVRAARHAHAQLAPADVTPRSAPARLLVVVTPGVYTAVPPRADLLRLSSCR